ncbi:MAG: sugar phosphate isomerase/epimerase [Rhodothermales bacterium]
MKTLTRRQFLGTSAMGFLALKANAIRPFASRFNAPLTFQYWVVREPMGTDLDGSLGRMREIGYDAMELCSPASYSQFVTYETTDPEDLRRRIEDAGLRCRSSHFTGDEVLGNNGDNVHSAIELAKKLRLHTMYISSAPFNEREATLDRWKQFADEAHAAGEAVQAAGLQLGYHNHIIGPEIDGKPQYDHLMDLLDPDLVKMQFQIGAGREGYDVVEYLKKYAGRFTSLHLSDFGSDRDGGVPVGNGILDWPELFEAARMSDIDEFGYIVEVGTEEPFEGVTKSYEYLSRLEL